MKITNVNDITILTSDITKAAYDRISKHAPQALQLLNEDREPIFRVCYGKGGDISKYGIAFDGVDEQGKMFVSFSTPDIKGTAQERQKALLEQFGTAIAKAKLVEANVAEATVAVDQLLNSMASDITVLAAAANATEDTDSETTDAE